MLLMYTTPFLASRTVVPYETICRVIESPVIAFIVAQPRPIREASYVQAAFDITSYHGSSETLVEIRTL